MPPDHSAADLVTLLDASSRRRRWSDDAEAGALALPVAGIAAWGGSALLPSVPSIACGVMLGAVVGVIVFVRRRDDRTAAAAARRIEGLRPGSRNVVITAEELCRHPNRASAWMRARVHDDASRAVQGLTAADVVPLTRTVGKVGIAVVICVALSFLPGPRRTATLVGEVARSAAEVVVGKSSPQLTVTVRPPAYARLDEHTVTNPERLDVLEGTRLRFTMPSQARIRFGATLLGVLSQRDDALEVTARDSGYFAVEPPGAAARLIALSVTRDRSPSVKIEQPAKDLLLPDSQRSIPVRVSASDDLALSSLELRYTKVSGSGEQFEFQEGTLPLRVARSSTREWQAQAQLALNQLSLAAGDALVYRAVARDARGGDEGIGASDTYFIEIAGPGQVPLEGVEMPPEEERYALSQQMIVLKIERLMARQRTMPRDAVVEESALIAAEQRSVRANFVFLLGGHVEDEEVEAEQSSEIAEGRLQNTARRDIGAAIGHMTRAEQGLVAVNASAALPPAREAVDALQRAFGRSRYLLRSLASRSRLDPSRRLSGDLSKASAWRRAVTDVDPREGESVRELLGALMAAHDALDRGASPDLATLAERALAIAPASPRWQQSARELQRAVDQSARREEAKRILAKVITDVAGVASTGLVPPASAFTPRSSLERAWGSGGSR